MRGSVSLVVALLAASMVCAQDATNLLRNPGFEETEGDQAVAWTASMPQGAPEFEVESGPHGNCARITANTPDDHGRWYQAGIEAEPEVRVYRLSARIRTDLEGCAARVCPVYHKDGQWHGANYQAILVEGKTDWQRYSTLIQPPPGTTHIDIQLRVNFLTIGTGTAWFDDIALEAVPGMESVPPISYQPQREMPAVTDEARERGFVTFPRRIENIAMPGYVPSADEIGGAIEAFAAPGQRLNVSFCLRSLRELSGVSVAASALACPAGQIPTTAIAVRPAQVLERMIHHSRPETIVTPTYLEPVDAFDIPADTTTWCWVTVRVPEGAHPGAYEGSVEIRLDGEPRAQVPLHLEVLPIELLEPDAALGFYYLMRNVEGDPDRMREHFRQMRERGMTSIGLVAGLHLENRDGAPVVIWDADNELSVGMDAWTATGFTGPMVWLMHGVHQFCIKEFGELESEEFGAAYRSILEQVEARAAKRGWPQVIYQPIDEPVHRQERMAVAVRCLQIMKSIPVLTEEDGNLRPGDEDFEAMYPMLDLVCCNFRRHVEQQKLEMWESEMVARCRADGKMLWTYNIDLTGYHPEVMRFGMGFGREACHSGGMLEWVWQSPRDDPYAADPGRRRQNMTYWYAPHGDRRGGPSVGFEGAAEGATDAAYLATFKAAAERARASEDAELRALAEEAQSEYREQLSRLYFTDLRTAPAVQGEWTVPKRTDEQGRPRVGGEYKMPNGWSFADYDRTRRLLADWILRLER